LKSLGKPALALPQLPPLCYIIRVRMLVLMHELGCTTVFPSPRAYRVSSQMAKIVAVHGTFASGPLEGRKWWQRGSDFTRRLSQLVEAEDGPLTIQPYVRDGQNSETSRRRAGQKLYERRPVTW